LRSLIEVFVERTPLCDCHELTHGGWRKTRTIDARQRELGFTVASTESVHTADFLCAAYVSGDRTMRGRIRKLAERSITVPERRYAQAARLVVVSRPASIDDAPSCCQVVVSANGDCSSKVSGRM
jgi:hypothetical protein